MIINERKELYEKFEFVTGRIFGYDLYKDKSKFFVVNGDGDVVYTTDSTLDAKKWAKDHKTSSHWKANSTWDWNYNSLNESSEIVKIDSNKLLKLMKKYNYDYDSYFEFLSDRYGFKRSRDYNLQSDGLTFEFNSNVSKNKIQKFKNDLGGEKSMIINEASLTPVKVGWNGEENPKFPDGTPQMDGYNSAVSVYVGYESWDKVYYVVVLDETAEDHQYQKEFRDKDSAIKFGNKVLSTITKSDDTVKSKLLKMGLDYIEV